MLTFRYTAVSDEKREGLICLGFNLATGAMLEDILPRLQPALAHMSEWQVPSAVAKRAAGPAWDEAKLAPLLHPLLDVQLRESVEPFLRTMRRRLERDRNRVHAYHNDLRRASLQRLAALAGATGKRAETDRQREMLRVAAIEREYRVKLDDLRRNYALRVSVEWVQALDLYVPVQRFDVLIRRRKRERLIQLDWHPLAKAAEPPLCEAGLGRDRARLVCDDQLHLTDPSGQGPCSSCGKSFCRACHEACPRCRKTN
jgi:hypothetical protein